MIKVILSGHGNFASGLLSAYQLLAGETEQVAAVDFLESYSTDHLSDLLKEEIDKSEDDVLIMTDLQGGSPYNVSVLLGQTYKGKKKVEVIAGTNFPMVLGALLTATEDVNQLIEEVINAGTSGIHRYQPGNKKMEIDDDDGI